LTAKYTVQSLVDGSAEGRLQRPLLAALKSYLQSPNGQHQLYQSQQLASVAQHLDCSCAQLAIAWTLHNKNVSSCLLGVRNVAQLEENLGALAVLPLLTPEVLQNIESIVRNAPHIVSYR